jgi:hypothetical protein
MSEIFDHHRAPPLPAMPGIFGTPKPYGKRGMATIRAFYCNRRDTQLD